MYASGIPVKRINYAEGVFMQVANLYSHVKRNTRRAFIGFMLAASATALVAAPAAAQTQGVTDSEILIGALGPVTGTFAFIGAAGQAGISLAIDKINESGGINGRRLKLIFENAGSPAESVAAAKKLVENDKVFALILASGSTGAAAAADYVRAAKVPTYNIYGATPIIRNPFARNVFHGAMVEANVSGKGMIDQVFRAVPTAKKIGILAGTYGFPQSTLKAIEPQFASRPGVQVVVQSFDQGARDYTSQLLGFARQKVDAVLVLGSFAEAGYAIKQGSEKGLANVAWVLDSSGANDSIVTIIGRENAKNVWGYYNTPYFPGELEEAPMANFRKIWIAKHGEPPQARPNLYDQIGYGSVYVLAHAIKNAGKNLSWDSLINSWEKLHDAKPSSMGGYDVIFAESFSPDNHQGNKGVAPARIVGDKWKVIR
jgi:branched-chain amino acid transport system substrate-binding protein